MFGVLLVIAGVIFVGWLIIRRFYAQWTLALAGLLLVCGISRSMSPVSSVAIVIGGIAGLSPFEVVRRTIPVMAVAAVVTVASSLAFL